MWGIHKLEYIRNQQEQGLGKRTEPNKTREQQKEIMKESKSKVLSIHLDHNALQEQQCLQQNHFFYNTDLYKTATFFDPHRKVISTNNIDQDDPKLSGNTQQPQQQQKPHQQQQLRAEGLQKNNSETRNSSPCDQLSFRARFSSLEVLKTEGQIPRKHESPIVSKRTSFALGLMSSPMSQQSNYSNRNNSLLAFQISPRIHKNNEFAGTNNRSNVVDTEFWKKVNRIITDSEDKSEYPHRDQTMNTEGKTYSRESSQKKILTLPSIPSRFETYKKLDIPLNKNILIGSYAGLDSSSCSTRESFRQKSNQPPNLGKQILHQMPISSGGYLGLKSPSSKALLLNSLQPHQPQENQRKFGCQSQLAEVLSTSISSPKNQPRNSFKICATQTATPKNANRRSKMDISQGLQSQSPFDQIQDNSVEISNQCQQYQIKLKKQDKIVLNIEKSFKAKRSPTNEESQNKDKSIKYQQLIPIKLDYGQESDEQHTVLEQQLNNKELAQNQTSHKRTNPLLKHLNQKVNFLPHKLTDVFFASKRPVHRQANNEFKTKILRNLKGLKEQQTESINVEEGFQHDQPYAESEMIDADCFLKCDEKLSENDNNEIPPCEIEDILNDKYMTDNSKEQGKLNDFSFEQVCKENDIHRHSSTAKKQKYCEKRTSHLVSKQQNSLVKKLFKLEETPLNDTLTNNNNNTKQKQICGETQCISLLKQIPRGQSLKQFFP